MNSQINTRLGVHHIESHVQDAVNERLARELRRHRRDAGRSVLLKRRGHLHVRVTAGA